MFGNSKAIAAARSDMIRTANTNRLWNHIEYCNMMKKIESLEKEIKELKAKIPKEE